MKREWLTETSRVAEPTSLFNQLNRRDVKTTKSDHNRMWNNSSKGSRLAFPHSPPSLPTFSQRKPCAVGHGRL